MIFLINIENWLKLNLSRIEHAKWCILPSYSHVRNLMNLNALAIVGCRSTTLLLPVDSDTRLLIVADTITFIFFRCKGKLKSCGTHHNLLRALTFFSICRAYSWFCLYSGNVKMVCSHLMFCVMHIVMHVVVENLVMEATQTVSYPLTCKVAPD